MRRGDVLVLDNAAIHDKGDNTEEDTPQQSPDQVSEQDGSENGLEKRTFVADIRDDWPSESEEEMPYFDDR